MNKRKDPTSAGSPPKPSHAIPAPGNPPQNPPEQPTPSKPGDPINIDMGVTGLVDPRVLSPAPDLSPGLGTPLNLEPLTGPTEASEPEEESEVLDLEGDEGLIDPRRLTPGPADHAD